MARILGLDLGSYSLKGLMMETAMRGYTVRGWAEVPLGEDGDLSTRLAAALPELLQKLAAPADTVVVSLPGAGLATHGIHLPFSDPKKVEATLSFEVENELPFDLDEAVYDYQVGASDEKGSSLVVGVVRRNELGYLLEKLKAAKVDPRIVTHPALAYQNLLKDLPAQLLPESPDAAVAIVDIGHERTNIAIGLPNGGVEVARTIAGGGLQLTLALAKEFQISPAEAQAWKEEHGSVGLDATGADAERAAGAFLRGLHPVVRELRPTFKSYNSRSHRAIGRILLCGGTAHLKGLAEQLERDLGLPCAVLPLPMEASNVLPAGVGPQAAQAWALARRGEATGARAPRFNLRRGEFAFKSDLDFMKDKVAQLGAFALVLFVLLIASSVVKNALLERSEKQIDAVLCETTQRILGTCEKDFMVAINKLSGQESPAAGVPKRSAVSLLAELTQRMPQNINATMDQIVIDMDRIGIRCQAATSNDMEDIVTALKTYRCFKEIKEGKVEKTKDGSHVTFRLDIQVECPEDAATPQG
jgi:general secretion pathway protein L